MDDLQKSLMRDMIREELAALLPGALAAAVKAQPKPRSGRAKAAPVDLTPIHDQVQERLAAMEAQVMNMVNSAESQMSAHLAAASMLRQGQP